MRSKILAIAVLISLTYSIPSPSQQIDYKKIDNYLSSIADSGFSGVVLIAYNDSVEFRKSYGWADRERKTENTPAIVFPTGSVSKQFTAAAIVKLEEEDY